MKPLVLELPAEASMSMITIDTQIDNQDDVHPQSLETDTAYGSMHEEISKVADPVSFEELKDFYNI